MTHMGTAGKWWGHSRDVVTHGDSGDMGGAHMGTAGT